MDTATTATREPYASTQVQQVQQVQERTQRTHCDPAPPAPEPGDSLIAYGGRVLCYVLEHRDTRRLSTEQLEQAERAGQIGAASQAAEMPELARERIREARHLIALTLRLRARLDQETAPPPRETTIAPPPMPNQGPMAPLRPVPLARPPAGQAVRWTGF